MNPLPFLALATIVASYSVATDQLGAHFDPKYDPTVAALEQGGTDDFAVYDLVEDASVSANAQRCETQATLAEILSRDFEETPVEQRVVGDGMKVELWSSDRMGTWTLVHNGADGRACVVTTGIGWTHDSSPDAIFAGAPLFSAT